ncbi:uncharacterized protein LOC132314030 [Cornus florida]|uniref:uncharacterized protein LOC132314030 n=1 Tax=Cornus florida TaxID=4283 RepID=UPI002896BE11|nr:uncharacterized protein LOC132314030 [Cornus florida]
MAQLTPQPPPVDVAAPPPNQNEPQAESSCKLTVWSNGVLDGAGVKEAFDEKRLLRVQTPAEMARQYKNSLVKTPFTDNISLRWQVENMILRGELADYLTTKEYVKPQEVNPRKVEGNQVTIIHTIHGRSEDDQESEEVYRSQLRTTHKLRRLSSVNAIALGSIHIGFGDGDLSRVQLPHEDPLVINLLVANCMIKRVLIDPGNSVNIITNAVFEQLEIPSSSIRPTSSPLIGFDGTKVDPLEVIDLSVTAAKRTLKENFVHTEIHPSYNLIMGRG